MRIKPLFAWYDIWVGAFWDRTKRKLYVLPLPMLGFVVEFPLRASERDELDRLRSLNLDAKPQDGA